MHFRYIAVNEDNRVNKFTHKPVRHTYNGRGIWVREDFYTQDTVGASSKETRDILESGMTWKDEPIELKKD